MARTPKELAPVDRHAAEIIAEAAQEAGLSQRALEQASGVSQRRISKIMRKESPAMTIGEMGALAQAVGLEAHVVMRWAMERLVASVSGPDDTLTTDDVVLAAHEDPSVQAEFEAMEQNEI